MLQCLFQGPCSQNSAAVQNTVECLSESLQPGSLGTSETSRDPLRKGNFNDISKTIEDLSEEIGEEFAKKCHRSGQSIGRWENLFQLYCKENLIDFYHLVVVYPIMSRKIGERKHIVLSLATKIRVYSIQSINSRLTLYSLSINGRSQYKAIIRMMAIFHE
ncbi:hypothetical protein RIR_jg25558.t1 [Rhizophagus irregularis DAOM 181602=DAOM 197198]|nr:hypothetical protein RIR_jg25558.t1 [Rhizophagus irregularis DAOM 181602=DAOM 197198]